VISVSERSGRSWIVPQRDQLIDNAGQTVQTFQPELTDLQQQVLDLLHIPASVYSPTDAN
jgi:hypothetical protein